MVGLLVFDQDRPTTSFVLKLFDRCEIFSIEFFSSFFVRYRVRHCLFAGVPGLRLEEARVVFMRNVDSRREGAAARCEDTREVGIYR